MFFACRHLFCSFQTAESVVNCPTSNNLLLCYVFAEDSVTKCVSIMFVAQKAKIISIKQAMLVRMNQDKIYQLNPDVNERPWKEIR
jgi:hypothetical protein